MEKTQAGLRVRLRHLPSGLLACAALVAVGAPVAWITRGWVAAVGVVAGVVLVAASYTGSSLVIAWADRLDPRLVLPVGLGTYALKFTAIGLLMAAIASTGWAGLAPMGVGILAAAAGWVAAQAWWTWRAQIAYVEV